MFFCDFFGGFGQERQKIDAFYQSETMYCVYVTIGQKHSTVGQLIQTLEEANPFGELQ